MVMNVGVEMVSGDSVRVSWDSVDFPRITRYSIYYRQTDSEEIENSDTVSNTVNSILIENLTANVEYQFQVAAIAEVDGEVFVGQRSTINAMSILTVINMIPEGTLWTSSFATTHEDTSAQDLTVTPAIILEGTLWTSSFTTTGLPSLITTLMQIPVHKICSWLYPWLWL